VLGGTPQVVVRNIDTDISFSPDAKRIAYLRGNSPEPGKVQFLMANADGTDESVITVEDVNLIGSLAVAWSPDGKEIARPLPNASDAFTTIQLKDLASGKTQTLAGFGQIILNELFWAPDGRGFLAGYQKKISPDTRNQIGFISYPGGKLRAVTKDTNNYQTLSVSSDGKMLAAVQQKITRTMYFLPAAGFSGTPPGPAAAQNKNAFVFGWANSGDLYFDSGGDIVRMSADGSNKTTLLSDPASQITRPIGCNGGRNIVFTWAGHAGINKANIWRVGADGSDPKKLSDGSFDAAPLCSPDGKWVYYQDFNADQILRVPIDGGKPEVVPGANLPDAFIGTVGFDISRDGKTMTLVFIKTVASAPVPVIALVNLDAGLKPEVRTLNPDPRISGAPGFTPDGKALVYRILESGTENIWLQPLDGTKGRQITNFPTDTIQIFDFSPDGKTIGMLRNHIESDVVLLRDSGAAEK
jgi:Tol biopolymer transport system component